MRAIGHVLRGLWIIRSEFGRLSPDASNLLVRDGGIRGTVVFTHFALKQIALNQTGIVFAQASAEAIDREIDTASVNCTRSAPSGTPRMATESISIWNFSMIKA